VNPRPLLHLEGAAVLIASLLSYHWTHGSWLQFALIPDASDAPRVLTNAQARPS
jgi:hypothetical protein